MADENGLLDTFAVHHLADRIGECQHADFGCERMRLAETRQVYRNAIVLAGELLDLGRPIFTRTAKAVDE